MLPLAFIICFVLGYAWGYFVMHGKTYKCSKCGEMLKVSDYDKSVVYKTKGDKDGK